jgi:[ribosomal protein S5]-alanine N-acetyltransferase
LELEFGEYKLRNWQESDQSSLVKYANNLKIWQNLDDIFPHPYTSRDAQQWIKITNDSKTDLAIATQVEAIGGIGIRLQANVYRRSAEIGYWLGEPFWNKGIMTDAVETMVKYTFQNFDIVRIFANVFEWNTASIHVLEKNKLKREGRMEKHITKAGKTFDAYLYALVRKDQYDSAM